MEYLICYCYNSCLRLNFKNFILTESSQIIWSRHCLFSILRLYHYVDTHTHTHKHVRKCLIQKSNQINLWVMGWQSMNPALWKLEASGSSASVGLSPGHSAHYVLPHVSWGPLAGESVQQGQLESTWAKPHGRLWQYQTVVHFQMHKQTLQNILGMTDKTLLKLPQPIF